MNLKCNFSGTPRGKSEGRASICRHREGRAKPEPPGRTEPSEPHVPPQHGSSVGPASCSVLHSSTLTLHPALHPALHSKQQLPAHSVSAAPRAQPKPAPCRTHLLCDPQPHPDQVGIVHNVSVRQRGSFGAPCCPLKGKERSAMRSPLQRARVL